MMTALYIAAFLVVSVIIFGGICWLAGKSKPTDANFEDTDDFPRDPESIARRMWGNE